ncbi:MAG: hypothetical protein CME63_08970 [Halobacteriovoraceae bacterium]|nr:hypothetical protein [Halobacteriovoraceae bacterium]MBC97869.1 hypothetical protein [Halobacteriovoraceae bacterium]|tara:strand:+ start:61113 stop:62111 length:999 start_codon:yes stop_codon:yes gene_type:complete
MSKWTIEKITLPLSVDWKITRGQTKVKENLIVTYSDGKLSGKGEVSFLTGAGQTIEEAQEAFNQFLQLVPREVNGLEDFLQILEEGDFPAHLKSALETAYVGFLAELMQDTTQRVLGLREVSSIETSMSIPHMDLSKVESYIETNNLHRFSALKVKITSSEDIEFLKEISRIYKGPLRIDGNECFSQAKDCLKFIEKLQGLNIQFLEQPLDRREFNESIEVRKNSPYMIFADESLQEGRVIDDFQLGFHGINVKLSKAGGYYKAQRQLKEARELGLKTMLGCMVETSLGISCTMNIAHGVDYFDLDGFLLLKEDPFQYIYEEKGRLYYSHQQ